MTRILGISGSLRRHSYNSALLRAARSALPAGVAFREWLGLDEIPVFNEDVTAPPASVRALKEALADADAVLFATPEYNASVPGGLKNALDWASRPFLENPLRGKPAAVIGASQGVFGAIWAQAELRKILRTLGADVDERELVVPEAQSAFRDDGSLRDEILASALRTLVADLASVRSRCAA
jgi:chromate reductase